jgi:hypothetical protein
MKTILRAILSIIMIVITVILSPFLGKPPDGKDWEN